MRAIRFVLQSGLALACAPRSTSPAIVPRGASSTATVTMGTMETATMSTATDITTTEAAVRAGV
ncbi:MAG: hypothetical protein E6K44_07315 [Gammaproteobacteria bacterium]|nr:MAG: hypothetical protein E6K44_07315 [Gammaproteobacteria bacterium]